MAETVSINSQGGGGEPHVAINSDNPDTVAIGNEAIVLGGAAQSDAAYGVAIGYNADAGPLAYSNTTAIGLNARAANNDAVQIGAGNNTRPATLKFRDTVIANTNGIETPSGAAVPGASRPTGSLFVNTTTDELNFYSGGTWNVAGGGGGGGEDYFDANMTGTFPSATGSESLAIGRNTISPGLNGVAIGSSADAGAQNSISIGFLSDVASTGNSSIAIGHNSNCDAVGSIAIGYGAECPGTDDVDAIAIGTGTRAVAPRVVAIGKDIILGGTSRDSVFIGTRAGTLAPTESAPFSVAIGYGASAREDASIAIGKNCTTSGTFTNIIAIGYGTQANGAKGGVVIGYGASNFGSAGTTNTISIGSNSFTSNASSIAIGYGASSNTRGVAIGQSAVCNAGTVDNVQLGTGTNTTSFTMKFRGNTIANNAGTQCTTGASAPSGSPADGTFYLDTSTANGTLHMYSNGAWRVVQAF